MTGDEARFQLKIFENKMKTKLSDTMIPERMWAGIINYVMRGVVPGHFLIAVFSNDLIGAFEHADGGNERVMKDYAIFVYNHIPSDCWGSNDAIQKWHEFGGMSGYYAEQLLR